MDDPRTAGIKTLEHDGEAGPYPVVAKSGIAEFVIEKALYEIAYEMNNRPDWLPIPVSGLERILNA